MGNNIRKKTITGWFFGLFGYVKEIPVVVKVEGKPLHVNPPFESKVRLKRAITRLRVCKLKLESLASTDSKRASWESEAIRREQEIERFGEVI